MYLVEEAYGKWFTILGTSSNWRTIRDYLVLQTLQSSWIERRRRRCRGIHLSHLHFKVSCSSSLAPSSKASVAVASTYNMWCKIQNLSNSQLLTSWASTPPNTRDGLPVTVEDEESTSIMKAAFTYACAFWNTESEIVAEVKVHRVWNGILQIEAWFCSSWRQSYCWQMESSLKLIPVETIKY